MSKKELSKLPQPSWREGHIPRRTFPTCALQDGCPYLAGVGDAVAVAAALCWWWVHGDDCHVLPWGEGWGWLDQGRSVPKGWAQASLLGQDLLVSHGVKRVGEAECWTAATGEREIMRSYFKQHLLYYQSLIQVFLETPRVRLQCPDAFNARISLTASFTAKWASANLWIILTQTLDWLWFLCFLRKTQQKPLGVQKRMGVGHIWLCSP